MLSKAPLNTHKVSGPKNSLETSECDGSYASKVSNLNLT